MTRASLTAITDGLPGAVRGYTSGDCPVPWGQVCLEEHVSTQGEALMAATKLLGDSTITMEDLGKSLNDAAEAFVQMAQKFKTTAQLFSTLAKAHDE